MAFRGLPLLVGLLVIAGLGFGLLGVAQLASDDGRTRSSARASVPEVRLQPVVIAAERIARGAVVAGTQLSTISVEAPVPAGVWQRPGEVVGKTALTAIEAGQVVTRQVVADSPDGRGGLALLVPPGKRAVALRITDEIAVGNFLVAGDRVDVFVRLTPSRAGEVAAPTTLTADRRSFAVLQDIEVLSFGEALQVSTEGEAVRAQTVTLAVDAEQANTLNLLAELGSFYLALRHPTDDEVRPLDFLSLADLTRGAVGTGDPPGDREETGEELADAPPVGREPHRVVVIRAGTPSIEVVTESLGDRP